MNGLLNQLHPSHLHRGSLVLICGVLCAALLGATRSHPKTAAPTAAPVQASPAAGSELLHDVTVASASESASSASASVSGHRTHKVWLQVTAYCACPKCCGPNARGLTASGRPTSYNDGHFVAADTKLFKFGTKLRIPGYAGEKPVEVIDRGGAIKGYHIDVFFPTHEQARVWGKRWVQVTVEG